MKSKYRPEIDGLRAIAIISVVIYHAKIPFQNSIFLTGGYLGVDIFFVISGYLISHIIFQEFKQKKKISFSNFYQRRIRRIVPMLITVLLVSSILSVQFLMPKDLIEFSKSVLYASSLISNFFFFLSEVRYGAEIGLLKPLLHTWSLSVEGQFYLFFPFFFYLILRFYKKNLFIILFLIFLFSMTAAHFGSAIFSFDIFNFYSIHTRIWELLLGSLVAYLHIFKQIEKNKYSNILKFISLSLIIFSVIYFDENIPHPSLFTLIPAVSTSVIILFGQTEDSISKLLSLKFIVFIGLISYSLYLWHFPLFAFARITEFTRGNFENKIILGIFIILISILSYFFIERPFRNKKLYFKKLLIILFIPLIFIISFNIFSIYKNGFYNNAPTIIKKNFLTNPSYSLLRDGNFKICDDSINGCFFNKEYDKTVYAVGDSHLGSIAFDLKEKILNKKYNFKIYTVGGCGYFPDFSLVYRKTNKIHDICNESYFGEIRNEFLSIKKTTIIFHARWPIYFDNYYLNSSYFLNTNVNPIGDKSISYYKSNNINLDFKTHFKESLLELLSYGHKIIIVMPVPEVGWNVPRKIFTMMPKFENELDYKKYLTVNRIFIPHEVYKFRSKSSFDLFQSIDHKNFFIVYPDKELCEEKKNKCYTNDEHSLYYDDNNHLSYHGSKIINEKIIKLISE